MQAQLPTSHFVWPQNGALDQLTYSPLEPLEPEKAPTSEGLPTFGRDASSRETVTAEELVSMCPMICPEWAIPPPQASPPIPVVANDEALQPQGEPPPVLYHQPLDIQEPGKIRTSPLPDSNLNSRRTRRNPKRKRTTKESAVVTGLSPLTPLSSAASSSDGTQEAAGPSVVKGTTADEELEMEEPPRKKRRSTRAMKEVDYTEDTKSFEVKHRNDRKKVSKRDQARSRLEAALALEEPVDLAKLLNVPKPAPLDFLWRDQPAAALAYWDFLVGLAEPALLLDNETRICVHPGCDIDTSGQSNDTYKRHVGTHLGNKVGYFWRCPCCPAMTRRRDNAGRHLSRGCPNKPKKAKVDEKAEEFRSNVYLFLRNGDGYNFCDKQKPRKTSSANYLRSFRSLAQ